MEDLWERRLWHQLTVELETFFTDPASSGLRMRMFKEFVQTFEKNINQLKLVTLALLAKAECKGIILLYLILIVDTTEALEFMTTITEKVSSSPEAYVYASVETASLKLALGQTEIVRKDLDAASTILDTFDSIEPVIHAAYYRVNADYYSVKLDYTNYYHNALLYLACEPSLTPEDAKTRAYNLSIAALLGEKIYNFGELLLHPILNQLKSTETSWLPELLFAMNSGNLDNFNKLSSHLASIVLPFYYSTDV